MTVGRANRRLSSKDFKKRNKAKKKEINSTASTLIFRKNINNSKFYNTKKVHAIKDPSNSYGQILTKLGDM